MSPEQPSRGFVDALLSSSESSPVAFLGRERFVLMIVVFFFCVLVFFFSPCRENFFSDDVEAQEKKKKKVLESFLREKKEMGLHAAEWLAR